MRHRRTRRNSNIDGEARFHDFTMCDDGVIFKPFALLTRRQAEPMTRFHSRQTRHAHAAAACAVEKPRH